MDRFFLLCHSSISTKIDSLGEIILLDSVLNTMADFMNKVSDWLTFPSIPWHKFDEKWNYLIDKILSWNLIFPLTDIMIILGLILSIFIALMVFYTVVLIKSFIPFSGGK